MKRQQLNINFVRIVSVILVIANHTSPFSSFNSNLDFFVTRILARIAVPFFLMIIGYFSMNRFVKDTSSFIEFIKRISILYGLSVLLYVPVLIYGGEFKDSSFIDILKLIFIDGAMYHLWYFPALILGSVITRGLIKYSQRPLLIVILLYLVGLGGDSYYGLISNVSFIESFYSNIFYIFDYTRNGLFLVPMFFYLGYLIKQNNINFKKHSNMYLAVTFVLFVVESMFIKTMKFARHDSMTITLVIFMFVLFSNLAQKENKVNRKLSALTTLMYVLHPMIIILIRGISKVMNITFIMDNSLIFFLMTLLSTTMISIILLKITHSFKKESRTNTKRTYRIINEKNLSHNINEINKHKQPESEIMAVVKANAYGHGAVTISKMLEKINIKTFAVATLEEAIELRTANIKGTILILGHTPLNNLHLVIKHDLIQTIVSYEYAQSIEKLSLKKPLKSHIKVNTGMNRLGEDYHHVSNIKKMYEMNCLDVLGIFSHLAVADSIEFEDIEFTELQIARFEACLKQLEHEGIDVKKRHLQGSYGFTNYPHLKYDYIRMGIMLYGVYSSSGDTSMLNLKPVMSLVSRITSIRMINAEDTVSYGRTYIANKSTKIASVNIGYADGISRQLSNCNYTVLINGTLCPIIGRICMDQLMVDITNLDDVNLEDEVIIFGEVNRVEQLALCQKTITNEVLTTLNRRIDQ